MSGALLRTRFAAFAAKVETTAGTDAIAGTPGSTDWIGGSMSVAFNPQVVPNPEFTGSLDSAPGIPAGLQPRITIRVPLRGSGTAGTAPDWGTLMKCCTMVETVTAAAVGAPTAAAAGTTTSATAATPFAATAQLYRGMPIVLTGVGAETTVITDYTAGRVATFGSTLSTSATTGTNLQVPINVLYGFTSDESVYKTATIYSYVDGMLWRFVGFVGTVSVTLTTAGAGELVFEGMATLLSTPTVVALPAGALAVVRPTPPIFLGQFGARSNWNRTLARLQSLTLSGNVGSLLPTNPEALEGYDAAVPISRAPGGSIDPYMNTTTQVALHNNFRQGTPMPIIAIIGSTAGNRFALCAPAARALSLDPNDRGGLLANAVSFACDGADAGFFLAQF